MPRLRRTVRLLLVAALAASIGAQPRVEAQRRRLSLRRRPSAAPTTSLNADKLGGGHGGALSERWLLTLPTANASNSSAANNGTSGDDSPSTNGSDGTQPGYTQVDQRLGLDFTLVMPVLRGGRAVARARLPGLSLTLTLTLTLTRTLSARRGRQPPHARGPGQRSRRLHTFRALRAPRPRPRQASAIHMTAILTTAFTGPPLHASALARSPPPLAPPPPRTPDARRRRTHDRVAG